LSGIVSGERRTLAHHLDIERVFTGHLWVDRSCRIMDRSKHPENPGDDQTTTTDQSACEGTASQGCDGHLLTNKLPEKASAMNNRVYAESVSGADDEVVSSTVSMQANSESKQTPEKGTKQKRLTEHELAEKMSSWTAKAERHKASLEKSNEHGYVIALEVVAVDRQPKMVKKVYLTTLFGDDYQSDASVYRTAGKCTLLHEESTKAVIGCLPINVAIQFARMKVDVQTKVLDYFRAHPGQQPSKESLKAARRAGEMKQRNRRLPSNRSF